MFSLHTDTFKKAARAKADEVLRKDTTDFSEDDDLVIKTREQNITKKRKNINTDYNDFAQKCLKTKQDKYRSEPLAMGSETTGTSIQKPLPKDFMGETSSQKPHLKHVVVDTSSEATLPKDFANQFMNIGDVVDNNEKPEKVLYEYDGKVLYEYDNINSQAYNQDNYVIDTKSSASAATNLTQGEENQILSINCSNCVNMLKSIEDLRKTQLVNNTILTEIRPVVATIKKTQEEIMKELYCIKGISNAILANFDPNETPELGILPGFTLPLNTSDSLKSFENKLQLDATFRSLVVNIFCFYFV